MVTSAPPRNDAPIVVMTDRLLRGVVQRFTPNALRLPAFSRGRRDMFLGLNLGGAFGLRSLSSTLRKFCQEPRSVFTVLFGPRPFVGALFHEATQPQRTSHDHGKVIHEYGKANV